ncbi:glycosyltransferase family 2 protein [bacterium]|nr:glycosyltransferase family 2 protein [bacterium]
MPETGDRLLVVILPALNEDKTVASVIAGIPRDIPGVDRIEAIVIDDGSTDETAAAAGAAGARVVSHGRQRGVGVAFATGIDAALRRGADFIVNMDADGQFDPAGIPALLEPILSGRADFVTCTRFGKKEFEPDMPRIKRWGNAMMCRIINWVIWGQRFTDVSCGFRAYTRETALKLNLFGQFTYTQESFIDLASKGVRMVEAPLRVRGVREHGTSRVAGSLWRYGKNALLIILRSMRDVRPLQFFGMMAVGLLAFGLLCGLVVFGWWASTGHTSPLKSVLVGSATFLVLGFVVGVLALLADMMGRMRMTMEELLLICKRTHYRDDHRDSEDSA